MIREEASIAKRNLATLKKRIDNSKSEEIKFLDRMAHEITNLDDSYRGKLKRTFLLSTWASSLFSIEIANKQAYLGAPEELYEILSRCRIFSAYFIHNQPGLFIIMDAADSGDSIPIAIRIHVRLKVIRSIGMFKKLNVIKMDKDMSSITGFDRSEFKIDLKGIDTPEWENSKTK